ncbi:MAG: hypothetical protein J7599_23080 [Niabella sp.]|nr:hypothetical protein [Niabella sp.]
MMKSVTHMVLNNTTGGKERLVIANDRNGSVWSKLFVKRGAVMEQQTLHGGLFRFAADIGLSPAALRLNGPSSGGQRQRCCCFENRLFLLHYGVLKQYPIAKKTGAVQE